MKDLQRDGPWFEDNGIWRATELLLSGALRTSYISTPSKTTRSQNLPYQNHGKYLNFR